ncbi:hypothetical protein AB0K11_24720 [Mycobacterium sp. NPDC050551]|uniref:hypothetical protein n=1 Tax=Mycobacterium sp. NPDC050551 TaxID=3155407 RepID=UPI00341FC1F3
MVQEPELMNIAPARLQLLRDVLAKKRRRAVVTLYVLNFVAVGCGAIAASVIIERWDTLYTIPAFALICFIVTIIGALLLTIFTARKSAEIGVDLRFELAKYDRVLETHKNAESIIRSYGQSN